MSTSISSSPSPIDIQGLLTEFDSSGQSAAAFARSKGLAPWKIYNALQRRSGNLRARRRRSRPEKSALLPVRFVDANAGTLPGPLEHLRYVLRFLKRLHAVEQNASGQILERKIEVLEECTFRGR